MVLPLLPFSNFSLFFDFWGDHRKKLILFSGFFLDDIDGFCVLSDLFDLDVVEILSMIQPNRKRNHQHRKHLMILQDGDGAEIADSVVLACTMKMKFYYFGSLCMTLSCNLLASTFSFHFATAGIYEEKNG